MLLCKIIAPKYGVSPKTIRDIWRGRTWLHATEHLWTEEDKGQKSSRSAAPISQIAEEPDAEIRFKLQSPQNNADLSSTRSLAAPGPCNDHLRALHELQMRQMRGQLQMRGQRFDYHQAAQRSLNAACLPARHPCHLSAASPSPTTWASVALQQLALQRMQGCAAHSLNLAPSLTAAPAAATSNPPVFDPALLRQLCGPAGFGFGVGGGPLLAAGVAPGLPLAPLRPAYAGGAGFRVGGLARGAWGA